MKQNNPSVDAVTTTNNLNYSFTAIPTNLFFSLDNNCRSMLATLVQLDSYYRDGNGWFFRTCADLQDQTRLSQNLVKATLQTLFNYHLIEVKSVGQSKWKHANYFKVNFEKFQEYEKLKLEDVIKNPDFQIETVNYKGSNFKVNWERKEAPSTNCHPTIEVVEETVTNTVKETVTKTVKSDHNIDNINNIDNKENINNIDNILEYNINNNILIEKEEIKEDTQHLGGVADTALTQPFYSNLVEEKTIMNNSKEEVKNEEKTTTPTMYVVVDNSKELKLTIDQVYGKERCGRRLPSCGLYNKGRETNRQRPQHSNR
ncbi:MAG: hypothetical protein IJ352_08215 [Muribaculaceae bacterium]|nr:hypothetical protein [Muribaculaceae bacterium]